MATAFLFLLEGKSITKEMFMMRIQKDTIGLEIIDWAHELTFMSIIYCLTKFSFLFKK